MSLLDKARAGGAPEADVEHVRALVLRRAGPATGSYRLQRWAPRLVPNVFSQPQMGAVGGLAVGGRCGLRPVLPHARHLLGGHSTKTNTVKIHLAARARRRSSCVITAGLTLAMALPAMIALRRTTKVWPLRLLRSAALVFTFLTALVDFATEGFAP